MAPQMGNGPGQENLGSDDWGVVLAHMTEQPHTLKAKKGKKFTGFDVWQVRALGGGGMGLGRMKGGVCGGRSVPHRPSSHCLTARK